jgi:potassium/hydrogen antiporter
VIATLLAQAAGLNGVPLKGQLLFIGLLFLGTLARSRFSVQIGIPAILGVLLLGLAINIQSLNVSHAQAESLIVGALLGNVAKFVINELAHDKSQPLIVAMYIAF